MAVTVAIRTPPMVTLPPKRARMESAGLPPLALSLAAKNGGISLPVTILDFLANAMFTVFEFGMAETDMSGLAQVPESGALLCALPRWSPCMCVTKMMSILPRRGSVGPATVRPGSYSTRVPFGSSNTSARSCGQNSPSIPPSGVTLTVCASAAGADTAVNTAAAAAKKLKRLFIKFLDEVEGRDTDEQVSAHARAPRRHLEFCGAAKLRLRSR